MNDFQHWEAEREIQRKLQESLTWRGKPIEMYLKFPWGERKVPVSDEKYKAGQIVDMDDGHKKVEMVNHPAHYGGGDNPYEVIKILEHTLTEEEFVGFCKGTSFRYMARAKTKYGGNEEQQDYKKSEWYVKYMNDFIERNRVK